MSMMLRRHMMRKAGGDWRDLYQQVAYLESTGTQYIDTGVIFNAGIKILARMGWTTSHRTETLFGARTDTGATRFLLCNYSGIDYAYGLDYVWGDYTVDKMYDFIFDTTVTNTFTYGTSDGTKTESILPKNTNTTGYIFAYHRASDDTVQSYASAKCASFIIENAAGTKLRDMIPCYRKADNKPGMYDTVSGTFYTNAGTGEFLTPTEFKWAYEDKVYNITSPFDLRTQNGMGITESFPATTGEMFRCYYTNPNSISMGGYNKLWAMDSSLNRINYKSLGNTAGTEVRIQATIDNAVSCAQLTIPLAGADDSYIYRESTGEIVYAGKNSIYYGHRNISEVSA